MDPDYFDHSEDSNVGVCHKLVAVIGCVFDVGLAILAFVYAFTSSDSSWTENGRRTDDILFALFCLVLACSYLVVVFARNPSLFLPFLALRPVFLLDAFCAFIVFVQLAIKQPEFNLQTIVALVASPLLFLLHTAFYFIIFRAYVMLSEESTSDNANSSDFDGAAPTCCCGFFRAKVETAVPVVALVSFLFEFHGIFVAMHYLKSLLSAISNPILLYSPFFNLDFIGGSVYLIASLAAVFGQIGRNPSLFLPFLLIMPTQLVFMVSNVAELVEELAGERADNRIGFLFEKSPFVIFWHNYPTLLKILYFLLTAWFYCIIFRAYNSANLQKFVSSPAIKAEGKSHAIGTRDESHESGPQAEKKQAEVPQAESHASGPQSESRAGGPQAESHASGPQAEKKNAGGP